MLGDNPEMPSPENSTSKIGVTGLGEARAADRPVAVWANPATWSPALAHDIRPLFRPTSPLVARRPIQNLNGVLVVLGTGIPWAGVPRELNHGSGASAYRRLSEWIREDRWSTIRDRLQQHSETYQELA